ncbi:hypothetical protein ACFE04_030942 [Oxalis oulophora]
MIPSYSNLKQKVTQTHSETKQAKLCDGLALSELSKVVDVLCVNCNRLVREDPTNGSITEMFCMAMMKFCYLILESARFPPVEEEGYIINKNGLPFFFHTAGDQRIRSALAIRDRISPPTK